MVRHEVSEGADQVAAELFAQVVDVDFYRSRQRPITERLLQAWNTAVGVDIRGQIVS